MGGNWGVKWLRDPCVHLLSWVQQRKASLSRAVGSHVASAFGTISISEAEDTDPLLSASDCHQFSVLKMWPSEGPMSSAVKQLLPAQEWPYPGHKLPAGFLHFPYHASLLVIITCICRTFWYNKTQIGYWPFFFFSLGNKPLLWWLRKKIIDEKKRKMQWRSVLGKKRKLFVSAVPAEAHKPGKTYPFYRNSLLFTRDSCLDLFKYETLLEDVSR